MSRAMASAKSATAVGLPTWSATTFSGRPVLAASRIALTKFLPYFP